MAFLIWFDRRRASWCFLMAGWLAYLHHVNDIMSNESYYITYITGYSHSTNHAVFQHVAAFLAYGIMVVADVLGPVWRQAICSHHIDSASSNDTFTYVLKALTHRGRVTHICVANLTIIGSDNGLSPGRRQAIIWTNAGILFIGPPGPPNFSEILIEILTFSFKKMRLKVSSAKWRPFCLGLNVLN